MTESKYEPLVKIASGGMATVWVGVPKARRVMSELIALKRPHEHLLEDPGFRRALIAEAEVASKLAHENVVSARELEASLQIVMDYVEGGALGQALVRGSKSGTRLAPGVACRIVADACAGLHALHELRGADGEALGFVHRDVSPQNILIGRDGRARITDFGLAKCAWGSEQPTTQGTLKGKLGYMAPEYVRGAQIDRRGDVFAMGVVLWESLAGRRLFRGENEADTLARVTAMPIPRISEERPDVGDQLDELLRGALERSPEARISSAAALCGGLRDIRGLATRDAVAGQVEMIFGEELAERRRQIAGLIAGLIGTDVRSTRKTWAIVLGAVATAAAGAAVWSSARAPATTEEPLAAEPTRTVERSFAAEPASSSEPTASPQRRGRTKARPRAAQIEAKRPEAEQPERLPPNPYGSPIHDQ